jgi:cytoskeletal protein CcmA (bactofilin family)
MFGRGKSGRSARINTIIGRDTHIVGDVRFGGGLHVDGTIEGNVLAEDTEDAVLVVSQDGSIHGEVSVPNVILNGTVSGNVRAGVRMELAGQARVTGNVYYQLLEMEIGAEVNGNLVHEPKETAMLGYDGAQVARSSSTAANNAELDRASLPAADA